MKLEELQRVMDKTGFSNEDKKAVFALIGYKIENDMEKVEERMDYTLKTLIWVIGVATTVIRYYGASFPKRKESSLQAVI